MPAQQNTFPVNVSFDYIGITETGQPPYNIIEVNDAFNLYVHWELTGNTAVLANDTVTFQVVLESIGRGFEGSVGQTRITFPDPMSSPYHRHFAISCNTPASHGMRPGVYKVMVLATVETAGGNPLGIVGFGEAPYVQVYQA